MTTTIDLTRDCNALVDDIDADLAELRWYTRVVANSRYASRNRTPGQTGKTHMHRVVMERLLGRSLGTDEFIDHINGNGLDNRRCNLRLATAQENMRNKRAKITSKSGLKGACWHNASGRWWAKICVDGKNISLGYHDTAELAHAVYLKAADELFGEFAAAPERTVTNVAI